MEIQYLIVALALALAIAYAAYRTYKILHSDGSPCHGCESCLGCQLKEMHKAPRCEKCRPAD